MLRVQLQFYVKDWPHWNLNSLQQMSPGNAKLLMNPNNHNIFGRGGFFLLFLDSFNTSSS